jgi:hypothetical protein
MYDPSLDNFYEIHTEINNVSFIKSVIIFLHFIWDEAFYQLIRVGAQTCSFSLGHVFISD